MYICEAVNSEGIIHINIDLFILCQFSLHLCVSCTHAHTHKHINTHIHTSKHTVDDRPQLEITASTTNPEVDDLLTLRCVTKNVVSYPQFTWSRRDGRALGGVSYPDGSLVFQRLMGDEKGGLGIGRLKIFPC